MFLLTFNLEETELRKADRTVGVNCNIFPIFRQARPNFFRECFFKLAFAFADRNPPGSGTFDLSVGPF